jgi:MFS family permease
VAGASIKTAATDWAAVALVLGAGILAATFIGKLPPALPLLQREFGFSLREAGWVVAMFNTLAVASGIFFGLIGDRLGALRFCALGLLALAVGGCIGALANGSTLLLASRFIEGAGFVAVGVSAPSLIGAATAPADLRKALGLWAVYMPAGGGLAMLLAPALLQWQGWRILWLAGAAAALLMLGALAWSRWRYHLRRHAPRTLADLTAGLRRPAAWAFALAFACYSVQFFTVMVWLPTFLVQQRGLPLGLASLLTAVVVLSNVPGNLAGAWLLHRGVRRSSLVVGTSVLMALCAVAIFANGLADAVRFGACLGLSLFGGMLPTAALSVAQILTREPTQVGGIQGLMLQGSNLGQFVAPPLIAAVVGQSAWGEALPVLLACAAGGVACGLVARRLQA